METNNACMEFIVVLFSMQAGGWASVLCHTLLQVNLTQDGSSQKMLL